MKYLSVLLLLLLACSNTVYNKFYSASLSEKEKKETYCRIIFTDSLSNTNDLLPFHDYCEMEIKENDTLIIYTRYFNLYRNKYFERIELIDSTGEILDLCSSVRNPSGLSWDFWWWIKIRRPIYHDGALTAKVYLNNELIAVKTLLLKIK